MSAAPNNPSGTAVRFGDIDPTYPSRFRTFSPPRLFSPIGSNVVNLTFVIPGTSTPALVRGFGAVYIDTGLQHTAFQYFDKNGGSLGSFPVPVMKEGFSFLGVVFDQPVVAHHL